MGSIVWLFGSNQFYFVPLNGDISDYVLFEWKRSFENNLCVGAQPTNGVPHNNGKFVFGNNFTFHLEFLSNRYIKQKIYTTINLFLLKTF